MAGVSRVGRSGGGAGRVSSGISRVSGTHQTSFGRDGGANVDSGNSNAQYRGGSNEAQYLGPRPGNPEVPVTDNDLVLEEVKEFV